jgi:UDP-N-acetylmuramoyl-tripeptide--D-alanyl-D-alanine ligase
MMESISIIEIVEAINGQYNDNSSEVMVKNVCIDSRKVQPGDVYVSIIGEHFDGHDFIEEAIRKGAVALIVSKASDLSRQLPVIRVVDTVKAIAQLASYYRGKMAKPVIAVTGSVGKTSTKDMITTALSSDYLVHKTIGNFNNHIGLPLSIFGIEKRHDVVVLEMGMSSEGEIRYLTNIGKPNIAVITNIGVSHIQMLKTRENILKAKLEIIEGLEEDGLLILNANDDMLINVDKNLVNRMVYVGVDKEADYMAYEVEDFGEEGIQFKIDLNEETYQVRLKAMGTHNVTNALVGIACAMEMGLKPETFIPQLKTYESGKMRLNIVEKDGIKFVNDAYNASPDSMQSGLKVLKKIAQNGRSIAIIGNMLELGEVAQTAHCNVGKMCAALSIDFVAVIGANAKDVVQGIDGKCHSKIFETNEEIVAFMKDFLKPSDVVLLKGSRGMKMEQIITLW